MKNEKIISVKPSLFLNINSKNLNIELIGQENSNQLKMEIISKYNLSNDQLDGIFDNIKVIHNEPENNLELQIQDEKIWESQEFIKEEIVKNLFSKDSNSFKLKITIPQKTSLKISSKNGLIEFKDLIGNHAVKTKNASIKTAKIVGNLDIESKNGSLNLSEINGNLTIKTKNGLIKLNNCKGNTLKSKSSNGSIKSFSTKYQNVNITNDNGIIYFHTKPLETGDLSLVNKRGKITAILSNEIPVDLSSTNDLGKIKIGLEGNYDREKAESGERIHMFKKSGSVKMELKNKLGAILILSEEDEDSWKTHKTDDFDLGSIGDVISEVIGKTGDKIDFEKLLNQLKKIPGKFKKTDSNKPEQEETEKSDTFSWNDLKTKIEEKINETISKKDISDTDKRKTEERSKLKILEMVEDGKITVDDAEKLLKAIQAKHNVTND